MKQYDGAYFQRWYHNAGDEREQRLQRKVALAVGVAEYYLERPVESVLDIGCGEGRWRAPLLKLRPNIHYIGFDSSTYAVEAYSASRQIYYARFADFAYLRPCAPVDLVICADTLHYLNSRELRQGLPGLVELCQGVAFLETFAAEDSFEGDHLEFQPRKANWYKRQFREFGLTAVGSHCWLSPTLAEDATYLERVGK